MRKKVKSNDTVTDTQSTDYVVGQVSGSLFPNEPAGSGSLAALFSPAAAPATVQFIPAPKSGEKSPVVEKKQKEVQGVKGRAQQRQKVLANDEPGDCQKLMRRESSLQNADKEEQKTKRRAAVAVGDEGDEAPPPKTRRPKPPRDQEEEEKTKRTVFVGNLPASCTKKTLLKLFREKGAIESTRFRSVVREDPSISLRVATIQRKVHPLKQSLNAYVVFKSEEGAIKALERNGMEVEKNVFIRVDRVTENSHDHKRSVFVGNLAFELNDTALRLHFKACGKVEAVRLIRDRNSGLGKGFGYILFESADSVQLALKLDGSQLEGRSLRVRRSVKKEKKNATSGSGDASGAPKHGAKENQGAEKKTRPRTGPGRRPAKPSSFRGEMADAGKTAHKKKVQKKRKRRKEAGKKVHIE